MSLQITQPGGSAFPRKAWVDSVSGSDSTGALGREDRPFATISAAFTAAAAVGGNWLVTIMPGAYTDTGLVPQGASYNITTYWMPGASWSATGAGFLFDLRNVTAAKPWHVLGHGRFYGSNTQTGGFVQSTYGTTQLDRFEIEAEKIEPGTAVTTFFDLRVRVNSTDPANSSLFHGNTIRVSSFGSPSAFSYFRVYGTGASPFINIQADYIGGMNFDEGGYVVRAGYAEAIKLGTNSFSGPSLNLHCAYRFKGTAQPALLIRRGNAIISAPNLEVTDGAAPIIHIPANADTGDGVRVSIVAGRLKQWAGGTSPAIQFDAAHANFRVRLNNCTILMANTATEAIAATGAQTIEAIGSLTTNLALDADITVRGATPVVEASLWTDF